MLSPPAEMAAPAIAAPFVPPSFAKTAPFKVPVVTSALISIDPQMVPPAGTARDTPAKGTRRGKPTRAACHRVVTTAVGW